MLDGDWRFEILLGLVTQGKLTCEIGSVRVIFAITFHFMCLEVFVVPVPFAFVAVEHYHFCEKELHQFIWLFHLDVLCVADGTRVNVGLIFVALGLRVAFQAILTGALLAKRALKNF